MYCPLGVSLQFLGCFIIACLFSWFAIDRFQSKTKMWYLITLPILTVIFVTLTQIRNQKVRKLFSVLSIIIPAVICLVFGGMLLLEAIYQGYNSISSVIFFIFIAGIVAFSGSVLLIVDSKKSP